MASVEAFGGGHHPALPDIVLEIETGVRGDSGLSEAVIQPMRPRSSSEGTGSHSKEGVLIMAGNGVKPGQHSRSELIDIAPTVLGYLGLAAPRTMTGRLLSEY